METKDPLERLRAFYHKQLNEIADDVEEQYMKLPVDADGLPIRPGDRLVHSKDTIVAAFVADDYICTPYGIRVPSLACRLVKPDLVAEELAKFLTACGDDDPHHYDEQIAEFAERIRKVMELRSEPVSMRTFDSMETALSIAEKAVEIEELRRENYELCEENKELAHRRAELESALNKATGNWAKADALLRELQAD